jgi:selenium metabolism protein YedF
MEVDNNFLLVIKSHMVGDGEADLGEMLMTSFLSMILESEILPAKVICLNSGVFLTTAGSLLTDILKKFEEGGTEILSCSTCLNYYGRMEGLTVGQPTNMRDIVKAVRSFKQVIYA